MQITLTSEQQAAFCRGESITINPQGPKWPFTTPANNDYYLLKVGNDTLTIEDHKNNNVFKHKSTVEEVKRKLHFILMCARFREYFEPDFNEIKDSFTGEKPTCYVYYSYNDNLFKVGSTAYVDYRSEVYMSNKCAHALVDLLNRNQVPELEL